MPGTHPVIRGDRYYPTRGEMLAVLLELLGGTSSPAAAEEEYDGGRRLVRRTFGLVDPQVQFRARDGLVGFDSGTFKNRRVGWRCLLPSHRKRHRSGHEKRPAADRADWHSQNYMRM